MTKKKIFAQVFVERNLSMTGNLEDNLTWRNNYTCITDTTVLPCNGNFHTEYTYTYVADFL